MLGSFTAWRKLHFWFSALLSLQLVAWFGSGLLMSAFDINEVRGTFLRKTWPMANWSDATIAPQQLQITGTLQQLSLTQRAQTPVYALLDDQGERYINAQTGQQLTTLSIEQVSELALSQYQGTATLRKAQWLTEAPAEARGLTAPLYRVDFSDDVSLYMHTITGQVLRVRTPLWRAYDFAWMLHIMDYQERENSHNLLVIISSASALLFALSGIVLLTMTLRRRRKWW